ncbi:MAG: CHAT domain-containing protein [Acidobacteriota bacterium]
MQRTSTKPALVLSLLGLLGLASAAAVLAASAPSSSHRALPPGIVVERVGEGFAAHRAGLKPGDVLLRWHRAASPPANPEPAHGELDSPFDLAEVELEQAPRGPLTVSGTRDGEPLEIRLPVGAWRLQARPQLPQEELTAYEAARGLLDGESRSAGLHRWQLMAADWEAADEPLRASWLSLRIATEAAESKAWNNVDRAFETAERAARATGDPRLSAQTLAATALSLYERSEYQRAAPEVQRALELRRQVAPDGLTVAQLLVELGRITARQGNLAQGLEHYRRALEIRQQLAPESQAVAASLTLVATATMMSGDLTAAQALYDRAMALHEQLAPYSYEAAKTLNGLGVASWWRGDLAASEGYYRRSVAIKEKLAPDDLGGGLLNLGLVAQDRGNLAEAEVLYQRSVAAWLKDKPEGLGVAAALSNLGSLALIRGDYAAAESYHQRALEIRQKLAPQGLDVAASLGLLARVAFDRGDPTEAEALYQRALAIDQEKAPGGIRVARSHHDLGTSAFHRQDFTAAADHVGRALEIFERLAPRSIDTASALTLSGDIALARSDLEAAQARYLSSLDIRRERAPGSALEATSCQRLGALHRRRGELEPALAYYDCAVTALEAQQGRVGGSDEVRSGFGARYADTYRQAIDLRVEVGHTSEAFHLLERFRARELLDLLAQRDLVFSADLPLELERRRRIANQTYDQALEQWMQLATDASETEQQRAQQELATARRQQNEIRAEVRTIAPRLAALQDPQPLDSTAVQRALDPGTLLLSYSIGEERGHVFAIDGRGGQLSVAPIPAGAESLRHEIEQLRAALDRGRVDPRTGKVLIQSRRLSELLLAPVAEPIERAERLLILADGPLHSLPFAALVDPADERRFLVATKPLVRAASATVLALLQQDRRAPRATRLAAFGDPLYPAASLPDPAPALRAAARGFELAPLPATRVEVESLRRLHGQTARVYLGADATEERAKSIGAETTHLHIATHGLLDDRFPLDSALAFTIPEHWQEGEDNGLLQAWEIFEQVRIDANLVTLSACDTGLGKVLGGEGLIGLTRAFQYAGARSVLASLWGVSDRSTAELMKRFYHYLEGGQNKDEALRSAQLDLLDEETYRHPFYWAGFQLIGDWQ